MTTRTLPNRWIVGHQLLRLRSRIHRWSTAWKPDVCDGDLTDIFVKRNGSLANFRDSKSIKSKLLVPFSGSWVKPQQSQRPRDDWARDLRWVPWCPSQQFRSNKTQKFCQVAELFLFCLEDMGPDMDKSVNMNQNNSKLRISRCEVDLSRCVQWSLMDFLTSIYIIKIYVNIYIYIYTEFCKPHCIILIWLSVQPAHCHTSKSRIP